MNDPGPTRQLNERMISGPQRCPDPTPFSGLISFKPFSYRGPRPSVRGQSEVRVDE
jgi:hypothetical protein